jgi:hypothetical protein
MSAMSQISLEIQEMLEQGHHPRAVSFSLEVPLEWVYDALDQVERSHNEPEAEYAQ